jgi:hypothetical protein
MDRPTMKPTTAGVFSQIGLFAVVACGTLAVLALTVCVPPWVKVDSQRRQILYWSERVKVYGRSFAGYDSLFADAKWRRTGPTNPPSETYFDATEYEVLWPLLVGEWVVVLLVGAGLFSMWSRRMRRGIEPFGSDGGEPSAPPERPRE